MEWILFNAALLVFFIYDLILIKKHPRLSFKRALFYSGLWILLALLFNLYILYSRGGEDALKFLTSYLIEYSLSVDNLFVFVLIFHSFSTPEEYTHEVLLFGILGAILFRALMIFFGITLISSFHFLIYILGAFLILVSMKMLFVKKEKNPKDSFLIRWAQKKLPFTSRYHKDHFFVKTNEGWKGTPLLLVLITIEITDVIFALDSIPAVFSITLDPFIVYTSNILAVMGLRSLYFTLSHAIKLFRYLHLGVACILLFVGFKMLLEPLLHISILQSLSIILSILILSILASLLKSKN